MRCPFAAAAGLDDVAAAVAAAVVVGLGDVDSGQRPQCQIVDFVGLPFVG